MVNISLLLVISATLLHSSTGHLARGIRFGRAATSRKDRLWPHGVIPYAIAANFTGEHSNLFKKAMRHWEERTCISFVPKKESDKHYILFTIDKCGCCSYVGRRGDGPQAISIGKNCDKFGIVVHELGHVVGFWHEHTRPDRDDFVDIFYPSIQAGQDYNFERAKGEDVDSMGEPYDFNSIMHYARDTFSRGLFHDTILPKPSLGFKGEIGQRVQLSEGDVRQTAKMYNCAPCGGSLFSPSGLLTANGSECIWRVIAPEGHTVFLNLSDAVLTASCSSSFNGDSIVVRDGHSPLSPILHSLCGSDSSSRVLVSSTNRLWIHAKFIHPPPSLIIGSFDVVCGGPLYSSSGIIQSPLYPDAYPPNADCLWSIRVPEGKQVAIKVHFFHLESHKECIYDRVVIYEGSSEGSIPIDILCGQTTQGTHVVSKGSNQVTLRFISDSSVQKSGFELEFVEEVDECSLPDPPCHHKCTNTLGSFECECDIGYSLRPDGRSCESTCGGFLMTSAGEITSPNFPDNYPSSKKCVWEIEASIGSQIFVNVTHLNIEGMKSECSYDYLRVGEKEKMCGEHDQPILLSSKDHRLRVEFSSDSSVERSGFALTYVSDIDECAEDNGGCEHECKNRIGGRECSCHSGFILSSDGMNCKEGGCFYQINTPHGEFTSPNYPEEYPRGTNCTWHFVTTPGHRLQVKFNSFNLEEHLQCKYDAISIQDGPEATRSSLGIFCGSLIPPAILSSSNQLILHFFSDTSVSRRGFLAEYESVCGGQLVADRTPALIYSHASYSDARYTQGRECKWRLISSSPSLGVRIKFESFHLEADLNCQYDNLRIYDSEEEDEDTLIGTYCGETIPPSLTSTGRALTLILRTDDTVEERGFVAEYSEASPSNKEDEKTTVKPTRRPHSSDFLINTRQRMRACRSEWAVSAILLSLNRPLLPSMASGDNGEDLSNWMTNLPLAVKRKPITKVAIPGSHDSFAFSSSLSTSLPVANDASSTLRRAGSFPGVRRFIKRWAVTQSLSITDQLKAGIRYFDLRISNPPMSDDPESSFRCVHALYGAPLLEIIESVREFLEKHPGEVVFIDMNHLYGFNEDATFTDMMQTILCVFSPSQIIPPPNDSRSISEYTLERLQTAGQNVILLAPYLGDSLPFTDILWSTRHIQSPWPDSDKIPYILQFLNRLSEEWRTQKNPNILLVYQGVATVQGRDIALHPFSSLERYVSRSMTKATCGWLTERSSEDGINIVIADFVCPEFSRLVTGINLKK